MQKKEQESKDLRLKKMSMQETKRRTQLERKIELKNDRIENIQSSLNVSSPDFDLFRR